MILTIGVVVVVVVGLGGKGVVLLLLLCTACVPSICGPGGAAAVTSLFLPGARYVPDTYSKPGRLLL